MPKYLKHVLFSLCSSSALFAQDFPGNVQVHFQDPIFSNGVLQTDKGGVIRSDEIRIQAQKFEYTNKIEDGQKIMTLVAEGDLLIEYGDRIFAGSKLQYDFMKNKGTLWNGRTAEGLWFVGGEKVDLEGKGSYAVYNAFLTTCEGTDPFWKISAKSASLSEGSNVKSSSVSINFFDVPLFWLPSFKANLKAIYNPPVRYKVVWDKGLGPRLTMRYRALSWENFGLFLRLDYRLAKGPGAAIESEYFSPDDRTVFVTRSYGAFDKLVPDEQGWKRYRLQGLLHHESLDNKTLVHATYDKYHDLKMISDFPSSDFEIDTQKRTQFLLRHEEDITFASIFVEPRLNPFESINQKLPLAKAGIRPFSIGETGILSENYVSAGYLDYIYASELAHSYSALHETHAARLETKNRLYRPFSLGPLHITPTAGVQAIFYNNNPFDESIGQGVITYGGTMQAPFYRRYPSFRHVVKPYMQYEGLSHPKAGLNQHYTFSLNDGLYQINSLKTGLCNTLFFRNSPFFPPSLALDVYTYAFFSDKTFSLLCPKGYFLTTWSDPSYLLKAHTCWNFQENLLDFANLRAEITVSARIAFALEFRHRSRFDWRKADHESFILDMARSIESLEDSSLSDKRNTFLSQIQFDISPTWSCHISSHHGWGRLHEPSYNSYKIDLLTLLASHWKLKSSYTHTTNDDRVSVSIQLVQ